MRALFYLGDRPWTGCARVFVRAAAGLAARGHQVTLACPSGSAALERIPDGLETALLDPDANAASATWELRKVLQERFVEVAFVHTEREQFIVSSALRLAERGAVIRRIQSFDPFEPDGDPFALRVATAGLLFSTEEERRAVKGKGWPIAAQVAPLGVDPEANAAVEPAPRSPLGVPDGATLIACPYDSSGRFRLATVMRTLALLAPRHPELHAVVFGAGSQAEDLRMHAAALGVTPLLTFAGDDLDPAAILKAADIVWVTAERDAGAFGCLDAMALGLPLIAERSKLTEHYVADGLTGVLLAPGEPPYVASTVAEVLAHAERRQTMGNTARGRVQREFTEKSMVDGFERAALAAGDRTQWAVR